MTQIALLTGGSRGIGAATANMLRVRGWTVVAPRRDELDLSVFGSVRYFSSAWTLLRMPLDALVMCAGEWFSAPLARISDSDYLRQFRVFLSHENLVRAFLPRLEDARGCVVAVASTRAFTGGMETAPYSVVKAALVALMQGFAREYGRGVRFNIVAPGLTDTDLGKQVVATSGAQPDAVPQPAEAVAAEIVRLIESGDNGRVMRVVDGVATEAKWSW